MGKWVHGSVHEEVSAADLEHLGALKLHDAPAHCNGVKPLGSGTFESVPPPKRLMDSAKIVIHEIEHQRVLVVLSFFENPFVSRVKRRIDMRIVKFSTSVSTRL
jgi:hypothetical protein